MKIVVLIPMHNFNSMTDMCVELCKKNAGIEHAILVVDDGSEVPYINSDVEVLRCETNNGFSKAINAGLKYLNCCYDYVCVLNNDTKPYENFLLHLVETAERDDSIGIVSSARVCDDEKYTVFMWQEDLTTGAVAASYEDWKETRQCLVVPFCSVLIRKECIQMVGLLDEKMVNYSSDTDYCLRALLMNYAVVFEPKSKVHHFQSVTCHHDRVDIFGDQKIFGAKWFGVALNEILDLIPINQEYGKYGRIMFEYEERKEKKPMILGPDENIVN